MIKALNAPDVSHRTLRRIWAYALICLGAFLSIISWFSTLHSGVGVAPSDEGYVGQHGLIRIPLARIPGTLVHYSGIVAMALLPVAILLTVAVIAQIGSARPSVLLALGGEGRFLVFLFYCVWLAFAASWIFDVLLLFLRE